MNTITITSALRVALLEDDPGMHARLAAAVEGSLGLSLVYHGTTCAECIAWLRGHDVDVLLCDLGLPDGSGIDVIKHARQLRPNCDVLVVTMFGDEASMIRAFEAGARGYLIKDGTEQEVARHVRDLSAGGSPMNPIIARRLLERWRAAPSGGRESKVDVVPSSPASALAADPLTPREHDVLSQVSRGFTYEEIAQRIGVQVTTIRTHVRNIYGKLDVHNKTEAVFEARALGLLR